jgi:hypothetical protein
LKVILKILLFLLGLSITLAGLLFLIVGISDYGKPSEASLGPVGDIIFILLTGVAPMVGGFILCKWSLRLGKNILTPEQLENNVLKLAEQRNGSLTAVELAMDTDLSLEEAEAKLDDWAKKGFVTIKVSNSGALIYYFNGIISDEERKLAKGVSDFE